MTARVSFYGMDIEARGGGIGAAIVQSWQPAVAALVDLTAALDAPAEPARADPAPALKEEG